ncbi:MAG: GNAT family N-acetyltransferase [candidate division Zixibacteria bacterium]|nr:GNAT family N-acetyltransferase [candidate division Zixibacteria bacterium]
MDYTIRPLKISEYDDLMDLWRRAELPHRPQGRDSYSAISRELKRKESCYWGMYNGEKLIGSVVVSSDGRRGWINRLAVEPDYRGRALAGRLIKEGEDYLHQLGIKVIAALIENENRSSIAAFKKAGYIAHPNILYFSKRSSPED